MLHPSNIIVMADLTGKYGGSMAFHYWLENKVTNRPLTNICCYKGDLVFQNSESQQAYFQAINLYNPSYIKHKAISLEVVNESLYCDFNIMLLCKSD